MGIASSLSKAAISKAIAPYKAYLILAGVLLLAGAFAGYTAWVHHKGYVSGTTDQKKADAKLIGDLSAQNGQMRNRIGELNGALEEQNAANKKKAEADAMSSQAAAHAGDTVAAELKAAKKRAASLEAALAKAKTNPDCNALLSNPNLGKCLRYEHH